MKAALISILMMLPLSIHGEAAKQSSGVPHNKAQSQPSAVAKATPEIWYTCLAEGKYKQMPAQWIISFQETSKTKNGKPAGFGSICIYSKGGEHVLDTFRFAWVQFEIDGKTVYHSYFSEGENFIEITSKGDLYEIASPMCPKNTYWKKVVNNTVSQETFLKRKQFIDAMIPE